MEVKHQENFQIRWSLGVHRGDIQYISVYRLIELFCRWPDKKSSVVRFVFKIQSYIYGVIRN